MQVDDSRSADELMTAHHGGNGEAGKAPGVQSQAPEKRQTSSSKDRRGDDRILDLEFGSSLEPGAGEAGTARRDVPNMTTRSLIPNIKGMISASRLQREEVDSGWKLDAVVGRFVEISSPADTCALTISASLILEAQWRNEPTAWIAVRKSLFFPPDLAASGIDLKALPILRVTEVAKAARMADTLLRSGGFGVVIIDLGDAAKLTFPMQTRLAGLAKKHHTALLCITQTREQTGTLGSLVSLRGETRKKRVGFDRFLCELRAVKDKRQGQAWKHTEVCRGPDGLC